MESIKDKVAVIGMGCTKFGERWDVGYTDLLVESAHEAFADAGIDPKKDIQAAWVGTNSSFSTAQPVAEALKLNFIPITRVENACATGMEAFRNACLGVASGMYDMVLAIGVEKLKDTGVGGLSGSDGPGSMTKVPVGPPPQFALAATRYFHRYGLSYEEGKKVLAHIAVKNHANGALHPKAHLRRPATVEQVLNAPMVAWPLGLFDCCGVSDGSAAAVITRTDIAKSMGKDYVLVKGLGLSVGGFHGQLNDQYDYTHFPENRYASQQAYAQAGIKNPREEIDLAEVHDCFTSTEMIIMEDIGFSKVGEAPKDIMDGFFDLKEGKLPVNPDGGLKCFGHPVGASGLRMLYEIYRQILGRAEPERQLKKADLGLAHNLGGKPGSSSVTVTILGRP